MNGNSALYVLIAITMILPGCAAQQVGTGSNDLIDSDLFLAEGGKLCHEMHTDKMWQFVKQGPFSSPQEAERYAAELRLGAYDDWRLPTKAELFDLFYSHYWNNDDSCVMNHKGEFWITSQNQEPASLGHWEDDLLCGPEFKFVEAIKQDGFVRAVRP